MGMAHRKRLLQAIETSENARYLEWGMGGTTLWLQAHVTRANHSIISIEHDVQWYNKVAAIPQYKRGLMLVHTPPSGPVGANATPDEEDSQSLQQYIRFPQDDVGYDVILVDGYARTACLHHIADVGLLAAGGLVFLHDAQRGEEFGYRYGMDRFETVEILGSCEDYPGPSLWVGRSRS
jgi:hypothetical protein